MSGDGITIRMVGKKKGHLFTDFGKKFKTPPSCDYMYLKPTKDGGGLNIYLIEQTDLATTFDNHMNVKMTKNIPIKKIFNYFQKTDIDGEIASSFYKAGSRGSFKRRVAQYGPPYSYKLSGTA